MYFYRAIEKQHNDLQSKVLRSFKKNSMLGGNLQEVRQEVDAYMTWLAEQEAELKKDTPLGYSVKDAETMLMKQNVS